VRDYSKKYFALANSPESKNFGITKVNANRKKEHTSWTLRIWTDGTFEELTFEEFQICLTAMLERHFDNHDHCGNWCKPKGKNGEEKKKNRLRWKTKNAAMYKHFKILHEEFMEVLDKLKQLFHLGIPMPVKASTN
jgi:hypothetical protein